MRRSKKITSISSDKETRLHRRRRSIPYGIDFDLDDSDDENTGGNIKKVSKKHQSLRSMNDHSLSDNHESEFDTDSDIFKARNSSKATDSMIEDIAKLSENIHSVALRDAYGRHLRRRDSIDSSYIAEDSASSLATSLNCSPLSTMSKIHFSSSSSASSRKSSNSDSVHSRPDQSLSPAPTRHARQFSANSLLSNGSRSPGMPRKVSNSANMLTAGLAIENSRHKKGGSRSTSRDHSPNRR